MKFKEKQLFNLLDKKSKEIFNKKFLRYYKNDSKLFINKISRDYYNTGKFPVHILKQIKKIPRENYDSAVCILRGALPYAILFEILGWKVHYVLCGRKNENVFLQKRFNKSIDKTLKKVKNKKILLIENNSPTGDTPILVKNKLKKALKIKKPDLFLDYFYFSKTKIPKWLNKKGPFWKTKNKLNNFVRVYEASSLKVSDSERNKLLEEFIEKIR